MTALELQFGIFNAHTRILRYRLDNKSVAADYRALSDDRFAAQYRRAGIDCHVVADGRVAFDVFMALPALGGQGASVTP